MAKAEQRRTSDVLIVETEEPALRLMVWALREEGLTVAATMAPEAAPAAIRKHRPDVVIINTSAKPDEKRRLIEEIRAGGGRHVIDLAPGAERREHNTGADAYLNKPYAVSELVEIIERLRSS
jgi:DNA-binding response OmpR family regulator